MSRRKKTAAAGESRGARQASSKRTEPRYRKEDFRPAPDERTVTRTERWCAGVMIASVAITVLAFFAIVLAPAVGISSDGFNTPLGRVVVMLPMIFFPLAIISMITMVIINARHNRRANDDGAR